MSYISALSIDAQDLANLAFFAPDFLDNAAGGELNLACAIEGFIDDAVVQWADKGGMEPSAMIQTAAAILLEAMAVSALADREEAEYLDDNAPIGSEYATERHGKWCM